MTEATQHITERRPIRTNADPEEIIEAFRSADDAREREAIRKWCRRLDSGRFWDFLDEAHNLVAYSDLTRQQAFEDEYSNHLLLWTKAFGTVEELTTFPDMGDTDI